MTYQVIDVEAMQKFSADGVHPVVLVQSTGLVTLLLCLEVGQEVGPCVMTERVMYLVHSGSAQLNVQGERRKLNTGSLAVVPADIIRTLTALERSLVLAIQVS